MEKVLTFVSVTYMKQRHLLLMCMQRLTVRLTNSLKKTKMK